MPLTISMAESAALFRFVAFLLLICTKSESSPLLASADMAAKCNSDFGRKVERIYCENWDKFLAIKSRGDQHEHSINKNN